MQNYFCLLFVTIIFIQIQTAHLDRIDRLFGVLTDEQHKRKQLETWRQTHIRSRQATASNAAGNASNLNSAYFRMRMEKPGPGLENILPDEPGELNLTNNYITYWVLTEQLQWRNLHRNASEVDLHWNNCTNTKIVIHGFTTNANPHIVPANMIRSMLRIGEEYKKSEVVNVLLVDWTPFSTHSPPYFIRAAEKVAFVAEDLRKFLLKLWHTKYIDWEKVHMIGFDLGAHIAGMVARDLTQRIRIKIPRITGLDPTAPMFYQTRPDIQVLDTRFSNNSLVPGDAEIVEIYHCENRTFGVDHNIGDIDIWFNAGFEQPRCKGMDDLWACSHNSCPKIFYSLFYLSMCVYQTHERDRCYTLGLGHQLPIGKYHGNINF